MVRADGDDVAQLEAMQRGDELPALAVEAIGEHDTEVEALRRQLLNQLNRELGLTLVDVIWLEAALGFVEAEGQREGHGVQHPIGIDGDDAIGEAVDVPNILAGGVVGGLPFLAVAGLVNTEDERPLTQRLARDLQARSPRVLSGSVGVRQEVVEGLRVGLGRLGEAG